MHNKKNVRHELNQHCSFIPQFAASGGEVPFIHSVLINCIRIYGNTNAIVEMLFTQTVSKNSCFEIKNFDLILILYDASIW